MSTKALKLKNGLQILITPKPYFESVGIVFGVKYGSIYENPKYAGTAHFIEHMLFKGTKNRSWIDIEKRIRDIAVMHNAETDFESTMLHFKIVKTHFEDAMELISDLVKNSIFTEDQIEHERGPIINEKLIHKDVPWSVAGEEMLKTMFKNHPAGRPIIGFEDTIKRINRKVLISSYKKFYTPKNSVITVYGGIDSKDAIKYIKKYFDDFDGSAPNIKLKQPSAEPTKQHVKLTRLDLKEGIYLVGFKLPSVSYDSKPKDIILPLLMSKIISDRLYDSIRGKLGLAYEVSASVSMYKTFSFLYIYAGARPTDLKNTGREILTEIKNLCALSEHEVDIESAKRAMISNFKLTREDSLSSALRMTYAYIMRNETHFEKYMTALESITFSDFKKFIKSYLDVKSATVTEMLPKSHGT